MKKKLSVLALTLSMVLGMLSGCGSSTGEEAPSPTQTAPADSNASTVDLCILKEADEDMLNTYSVLAVNPDAPFMDADGNPVSDVSINTAGTDALIHWLLLPETLALAGNYGKRPQWAAEPSRRSGCRSWWHRGNGRAACPGYTALR